LRLDFFAERNGVNLNVDTAQNVVYFTEVGNERVMKYCDLNVFDANRRPLVARMVPVDASRFAIEVEDQRASYPILVDPELLNDAFLNETGGELFGYSVAYIDYYQLNAHSESEARPLITTPDWGGLLVGVPHFDSGSADDAGEVCFYIVNTGASVAYAPDLVDNHEDLIAGVPGGSGTTSPSVEVMKWSPE
jgi:hypothetical protein